MICAPAQCDLCLCALNILNFLWPQEIPSFLASQSLLRQFSPSHANISPHTFFFFKLGSSILSLASVSGFWKGVPSLPLTPQLEKLFLFQVPIAH